MHLHPHPSLDTPILCRQLMRHTLKLSSLSLSLTHRRLAHLGIGSTTFIRTAIWLSIWSKILSEVTRVHLSVQHAVRNEGQHSSAMSWLHSSRFVLQCIGVLEILWESFLRRRIWLQCLMHALILWLNSVDARLHQRRISRGTRRGCGSAPIGTLGLGRYGYRPVAAPSGLASLRNLEFKALSSGGLLR